MSFKSALYLMVSCTGAAICAPALHAAPPLEAYGELPSIEDVTLSPGGTRMAGIATNNGKRSIVVFDDKGQRLASIAAGELKIRSIEFATDDLLIVQRSTTQNLGPGFAQDRFEFFQAMLIPIGGTGGGVVFANDPSLVDAVFGDYGVRMVEGRPKAYFGAIELNRSVGSRSKYEFDHGRPALYEVDLLTNAPKRVDDAPDEGWDRDWLVGDDGKVVARLDSSQTTGEWRISSSSGRTIARGKNANGGVGLIGVGNDGASVIYRVPDPATETVGWYSASTAGEAARSDFLADVDVKRLYRAPFSDRITGYLEDGNAPQPVFFNSAHTKRAGQVKAAFPQLNSDMINWDAEFDRVLVRTDGNADSGTYYLVDLQSMRAEAMAYERLAIEPQDVGPISTVPYKAADGLELDGILTLPPGKEARDLPLVVLPHGGPHQHDIAGFDWWAQAFAAQGYAVFQPNFRGSTNRDHAFVRAGYGEWGGKMQTDLSDGIRHLAEQGTIDAGRVCIVGASYGGYAALAGVTLQNGIYRCAVSIAGVSDLALMRRIERREGGRSAVHARSLEEQLGPSSRFKALSPRYHAERADAPILLMHGKDDTVVSIQHSKAMADALKKAGKPHQFVELAGEDHWLSQSATRLSMLRASIDFVKTHNPAP